VELWPVANDGMQYIEKLWQEYQLNGKNVVAVIIGSALDLKKWGIENYAKVIAKTRNLLKNPAFLIIGNLSDSQEAAALVSKVEGDIINLCGRTNLTDLPWIFDKVALAIGNDTGPMHIAISRGTPTVCILGGGQFGRFMPYGDPRQHKFVYHKLHCYFCDWNCVYPKAYCVHEISVDSVFNEIKALLAARQSHPILNVSNS
jgi:ADP-heptose:LPS heptosyltransferase